ncbi:MAG: DUF1295 domain-containing protein [Eubacteriales bacterium]|nr:DUF1295 domain-containing protein [Eubacteriales bacterium]
MGWEYLWIILIVCAAACAVGFKKFVYFLSIGYGFAIAAGAITVTIITLVKGMAVGQEWFLFLQAALFLAYGVRLSGFLLVRELKSAGYRKTMANEIKADKKMPIFVLATIWICVAVLYTAQLCPMFFRYYNGGNAGVYVVPLIGVAVSVAGLILESIGDKQKSAQKTENPNMVATKGLYKIVRCPNYFGEITFWTGIFISGIPVYRGVGQWIVAILAYICIFYIMINGAQRLDRRQEKRYGADPAYRAYADHTPLILPLIPICHIGKYKEE